MAKASVLLVVAMAAALICFSSLPGVVHAGESFLVHGKVYCDTCRLEVFTRLSEPIAGATVTLECRLTADPKNVTFSKDAVTDDTGTYRVEVNGDHENDICEVKVVRSPREDCNDLLRRSFEKARVVLTNNDGIVQMDRFANSLAVLKEQADKALCDPLVKELGLDKGSKDH